VLLLFFVSGEMYSDTTIHGRKIQFCNHYTGLAVWKWARD